MLYAFCQIILDLHPGRLGLHPQIDILGNQRHESARIVVPHPDGGRQDAVVLDIVLEKVL